MSSIEALEAFRKWINHDCVDVREHRKRILGSHLTYVGAQRVADMDEDQQRTLAAVLGITIPGPVQHMAFSDTQTRVMPSKPETNPIAAFREKAAEARRAKAAMEDRANKEGRLWTVIAAYTRHETIVIIWQGEMPQGVEDTFQSDHSDAAMFLEQNRMIGDISKVRADAVKAAMGRSLSKVSVTVEPMKGA